MVVVSFKETTIIHSHGFVMALLQLHKVFKFSEDELHRPPVVALKPAFIHLSQYFPCYPVIPFSHFLVGFSGASRFSVFPQRPMMDFPGNQPTCCITTIQTDLGSYSTIYLNPSKGGLKGPKQVFMYYQTDPL